MFRSQFVTRFGLSCLLSTSAAALALAAAAPAWAQSAPAQHSFDIPALPLNEALRLFMQQSGIQVSYASGDGANVRTSAVKGDLAPAAALSQLLTGTGLTYRFTAPTSAILEPAPTADAGTVQLGAVRVEGSGEPATGDIPTPKTDRAASDRSHSYAARAATVAGKSAQELREIPQSITVLTRQRLDDQNAFSLETALRTTTGVTAISYDAGEAAFFNIRGYPAEVQYDGLPAINGISSSAQFDLAIYDRLEVLRGPSGLLQGAGSPSGTVNLVRKRPHDTFGWAGSLSGGSWNNFHGDLDVTGPLNSAGTIRGRVVVSGQDRDFFIDKEHQRTGTLYGIIEADLDDRTTFTVSGTAQNQKTGPFTYGVGVNVNGQFVNGPRSALLTVDWATNRGNLRDAYASIEHNFGNDWSIKASADYRTLQYKLQYGFIFAPVNLDNSANAFIARTQYQFIKNLQSNINVSGPLNLLGRTHQILFGFNYAWESSLNLAGGETVSIPDIYNIQLPDKVYPFTTYSGDHIEQYGAYAQGRFSLADPLTLVVGGRVTNYRSEQRAGTPTNRTWTPNPNVNGHFTPSVGLIWDVTRQLTLYGSFETTFVPQANLTASGVGVKPRTGEQFEVGAKGTFLDGALTASAALFSIKDRNRAVADPNDPTYFVAAGKVRSRGAEVEINGEPLPGWSIAAGYTYLDTKYLEDPNSLGQVYDLEEPKHSFKLWTTYRIGEVDQPGFLIGGGVRAISKTSRGGPFQPGYAVFDAQVGYRLNRQWSATLTVNNLLDKSYYIRVPARFFGLYGDPRSFTVTLRKSF